MKHDARNMIMSSIMIRSMMIRSMMMNGANEHDNDDCDEMALRRTLKKDTLMRSW